MPRVPQVLADEATRCFLEYERVFVTRIAQNPAAKLVSNHLEDLLNSGDETAVRAAMAAWDHARRELESSAGGFGPRH
jgi:hypothetical protein